MSAVTITRPAWATKVETSRHVEDQRFYTPLAAVAKLRRLALGGNPAAFTLKFELARLAYDTDPVVVSCNALDADFYDIEDMKRLGEALLSAHAEAVAILGDASHAA